MNISELLENEAFKEIEPERKTAFMNFFQQIQGKSNPEIIAAFMQFSKTMPKGKPLSKEVRNAMLDKMSESLSPQDSQKFKSLLKMTEFMN